MNSIEKILAQTIFQKEDIIRLLNADKTDSKLLFKKASDIKETYLGKIVHFRGLIEFSNVCSKNCLYCGIRKGNEAVNRYNLTDNEILKAVNFINEHKYGSLVLQSGEIQDPVFTKRITGLLKKIISISEIVPGITLSTGEQSEETYREWFIAGATRYLLRIETSNENLYYKIHPKDTAHNFIQRKNCLQLLKEIGYQTGTGIMVGLPFQTIEDIADDIIFMKELDVHMVGLGPYIEHTNTPLYKFKNQLFPLQERFYLTLKVIAVLRIMMKDINIAAATALQSIDKMGREKAIMCGANIIMPNVTPGKFRDFYKLYDNKPCTDEEPEDCIQCLDVRIALTGHKIGYGEKGDSKHYISLKK